MNKLPAAKRVQILSMLCEGVSMRAISRMVDVSINTVAKALIDAGSVTVEMHDEFVCGVRARRIQCDEVWSFCYANQKSVLTAKAAPAIAGDVWTWTALDSESKLIVSYLIGDRSGATAMRLMTDLSKRLAGRVQLTTDGHRAYLDAVEGAFGADLDYALLVKLYGACPEAEKRYSPPECVAIRKTRIEGDPDADYISTSHVELRMHMRRFTRLTNASSKKKIHVARSHGRTLCGILQFHSHPQIVEGDASHAGRDRGSHLWVRGSLGQDRRKGRAKEAWPVSPETASDFKLRPYPRMRSSNRGTAAQTRTASSVLTGSVKPPSATRRANSSPLATSSRNVPRSTM
jgi:IS1 family transposase